MDHTSKRQKLSKREKLTIAKVPREFLLGEYCSYSLCENYANYFGSWYEPIGLAQCAFCSKTCLIHYVNQKKLITRLEELHRIDPIQYLEKLKNMDDVC